MNKILDDELSQYTINYLEDHDITPTDVKMIKNYIKENKKLINNLKVYFLETKNINKYKTSTDKKVADKIKKYNSYKDSIQSELSNEIKVLLDMKEYFKLRNTTNNLESCSGGYTYKTYRTVTVDILKKESLLLKEYIINTNNFLNKRPIELKDISMQSYANDVLDITENNLKNQEETYYSNYPIISKNQEYVRNIYNLTFNSLLKISSDQSTDTFNPKIDLYRDIKDIKKQYNIKKEELIDKYIENTYDDINKIQDSKTHNSKLFR